MAQKKGIQQPHLIICEGRDAERFMIYYLLYLILQNQQFELFQVLELSQVFDSDGNQVFESGGNHDLRKLIKTLPNLPNFRKKVKSIIVIRDSENDSAGANQSVQALLRNGGFAVPDVPCRVALPTTGTHSVKVGYALFPKLNSTEVSGTLEDLCLNVLANKDNDSILGIVDTAIDTYKRKFSVFKRPHKNRLHTYLSLSDDYVGLKIGESAKANAFNFSSSVLEPLRALLSEMLDE